MEHSLQPSTLRGSGAAWAGWASAALLTAGLCFPLQEKLLHIWRSDPSLSHAPVLLAAALAWLWTRKTGLRLAAEPPRAAFWLVALAGLLHAAAAWADLVSVRAFSLLLLLGAVVWLFCGGPGLRSAFPPLGLLAFTIPWPTTLVERIAFPLQQASSTYAALLTGLLGVPVRRDGVQLAVLAEPGGASVFNVLVARQCSGLTSLMVLLALGYALACFTPSAPGKRLLLFLAVIPAALAANALRLTFILLAGAYHGRALAMWVHDHEAPVLIFLCSAALMAVRQAMLPRGSGDRDEVRDEAPAPSPVP